MTPESIPGLWWLPAAPGRRIAGTLTHEGSGIPELALMEALSDDPRAIAGATLLGLSAKAEEVTVEIDFETQRTQHSTTKGHHTEDQSLAVKRAIVGAHLPEEQDRAFTHLGVEITDLLPWTGWRGPEDKWTAERVELSYVPPAELCAEVSWGRLCVTPRYGTAGDGPSSRSITVGAAFVGERAEPASVETWLDTAVRPLRDLLTIATDRANQVEGVSLWSGDSGQPTRLIYPPTTVELPARVAYWFEFLFTADAIANEFSERLARWFDLHTELGPALDLYLSTQYRRSTHLENRFLNTAGAVEAYHRRRFPRSQAVLDQHAERMQRIMEAVGDPDDRAWLEWKLKYAYEPSFADRIRELCDRTKEILGPWLGESAEFAHRTSRARNGLVHRDPADPNAVPDGRTLLDMTEDLALLFIVCLLQDLRFDDAQIRVMLDRTRRWDFLKFRKRGWTD